MAKQLKKKSNSKLGFLTKKTRVIAIVVVAVLGSLTVAGLFAKSNQKDYSLKLPTQQTAISLTNEKPLVITKDGSGQVRYESRGKSINVTTTGTVYCTPENDGSIKVATITQDQLSQAVNQVRNTTPTEGTSTGDTRASIGNTKQLQLTQGSTTQSIEVKTANPTNNVAASEKILDDICAKTTTTIPASQVPVFTPGSNNITEYKQQEKQSLLSHVVPKVSAGGTPTTTPPPAEPVVAPDVEADQIARINGARASSGLVQLGTSQCLTTAARTWSRAMALFNNLAHSSLQQLVEQQCGSGWWSKLGENVGRGNTSADTFQAYMNSPGHRANILDPAYQRIGVGANYYTYSNGARVLWTTQTFAACIGSCANK